MTAERTTYRDFDIRLDMPPIPTRQFDWVATHKDYDPTPDHPDDGPSDDRIFRAATVAELRAEIDAWHDEQAAPQVDPFPSLMAYVMFGRMP